MKKIFTTIFAIVSCLTIWAATPVKIITGNLIGDLSWSADTIYLIKGKVYLKSGGSLTIAPGTIIKGDKATAGSALIITRGAKINAIGTPTRPIVFTSSAAPGARKAADWGGLVIAGNAKNNIPGGNGKFEGGNLSNPDGTAADGEYGGTLDTDNSGTLKYVRIEFAGFAFQPNSELNSLTLGSVGSGTTLDYIQCSYGFDDAFEWFGGTVNAKHLVSFRGNDDDFDTDFGFRGNIQYAISLRDTAVADPISGANCFESDNDGAGSGLSPLTAPSFSNVTVVGPKQTATNLFDPNFRSGAHIRKNSRMGLYNSIIMGFPLGIKIDGDSCHKSADSSLLGIKNNVIAGCPKLLDSTAGVPWGITAWYNTTAFSNLVLAANADAALTSPFTYIAPNFMPTAASAMLTGAAFADARLANTFFDVVPFRGAMGTTDWTASWTEWDPQNEPYTAGYGTFPSSIHTANLDFPLSIYPIPAQDLVTIEYQTPGSEEVTFTLVNTTGVLVNETKSINSNHNVKMNISGLASGVYFVKISSKNGMQFSKLMVN
jgi:Secretion system C-terminal sorting domain